MTHLSLNGTVVLRECPEMRDALNAVEHNLPKDVAIYERPGVATVAGHLCVGIHGEAQASYHEVTMAIAAIQTLGQFAGVPARFTYSIDSGRDVFWVGKTTDVAKAVSERRVAKIVARLKRLTPDELEAVMKALQ